MSAPKKYTWISLWFVFSYLVVLWDLAYVLIRPASLPGGRFRWIWGSAYGALENFDKTYDVTYFYEGHIKSTGLAAKGVLNIAEFLLAMVYLIQVHIIPSPIAPIFGFTAAVAASLKCTLWALEELYCGWCTTGHNPPLEIFISWTFPTAVWTMLSVMAAWRLGSDMATSLKESAEIPMLASKSKGPNAEKEGA